MSTVGCALCRHYDFVTHILFSRTRQQTTYVCCLILNISVGKTSSEAVANKVRQLRNRTYLPFDAVTTRRCGSIQRNAETCSSGGRLSPALMPQVKIIFDPIAFTCVEVGLITNELVLIADCESVGIPVQLQNTDHTEFSQHT